ncbi:hypothetical protein HRbin09_00427 [bacterium HR09]|nr:hypothetical protein HRbin09_00427 [bacterium HR09]
MGTATTKGDTSLGVVTASSVGGASTASPTRSTTHNPPGGPPATSAPGQSSPANHSSPRRASKSAMLWKSKLCPTALASSCPLNTSAMARRLSVSHSRRRSAKRLARSSSRSHQAESTVPAAKSNSSPGGVPPASASSNGSLPAGSRWVIGGEAKRPTSANTSEPRESRPPAAPVLATRCSRARRGTEAWLPWAASCQSPRSCLTITAVPVRRALRPASRRGGRTGKAP